MITIAHIDDSHEDLFLTREQLLRKDAELKYHQFVSPVEAVETIPDMQLDCILCDYQMPMMNGIDVLRSLRDQQIDLPFIFFTGQGSEEVAAQALRLGATDYFTKNLQLAQYERLAHRIRSCVENHRRDKELQVSKQALEEVENRYRLLFERSSEAYFIVDRLTGRYLDANKAALDLVGRSLDELTALTTRDVTPDGAAQRLRAVNREDDSSRLGEVYYLRPDGTRRLAQLSSVSISDSVVIGIAHDITEQKIMEEQLRQSEAKFRAAFHTSPDAININRLEDGVYIDINSGFTRLTGYKREDVIGKSSLTLSIWADPADRERLIQLIQSSGQVDNMRAQFRLKDGTLQEAFMSARIITLGDEKCLLSITRPATETTA